MNSDGKIAPVIKDRQGSFKALNWWLISVVRIFFCSSGELIGFEEAVRKVSGRFGRASSRRFACSSTSVTHCSTWEDTNTDTDTKTDTDTNTDPDTNTDTNTQTLQVSCLLL